MKHLLLVVFALFLYLGLYWPDADKQLMSLLHHRSILTHSVLLPLLVTVLLRSNYAKPIAAGLSAGISIHLATNVISPMGSFSQIYLPAPLSSSIGATESLVWLGLNAIAGYFLAQRLLKAHSKTIPFIYLLAAAGYGLYIKDDVRPWLVCFAIFLTPFMFDKAKSKLRRAS
ncbi:hypothetical protein ACQKPX_19075 [Photobacterium sp. DNB23_23_1]|uniref:Metal-dependent hydrolase n=1 Tax=Photobacterium pectinilyticum TaxID=2906793 RepID=A0ABT1NBD4_9GAMM|nr:hypothetical protein [Photobacterium sp. ZSDE20]MCQ1061139.1 hypothetical protein [Photobacterium sp. ZSDE20]MDD1829396.1 hypothetical protein [Photobacterium sp. ZSDE20]